ncbi:MAG: multicopper oxidase domain-containing protein [Deltaproteobacteria bacterium]|nr:multicopper oxidase domain-containing protein [Deltaproteobacteria bacterium]
MVFALAASLLAAAPVLGLNIQVMGSDGQPVNNFRWLVEQDKTWQTQPGVQQGQILSTGFHRSYMPVVAAGDETNSNPALDPALPYFVSVLPDSGYNLGGAKVEPGQQRVEVTVNPLPLPTAQITVFVFEDTTPINNAPDLPQEQGLAGFKVLLFEAAGKKGVGGGAVMMDAFGNMLGTTYNPDGTIDKMGDMNIYTDENGVAVIKNLPPAKYGVQVVPPEGEGWQQTTTIEGTRTIDAWVKANEPPYFQEFGPPGWHVFIGFVKPMEDTTVLNGNNQVTGQVVNMHMSRPPDHRMWPGEALSSCWVGLNDLSTGNGKGVYVAPCDPATGQFTISNVPPGTYELVFFDTYLMNIFAFHQITVIEGQDLALGEVPVFQWFGHMENVVFDDLNENGIRDPGEPGVRDQTINLRLRDGTIYNFMPTDGMGTAPFEEVFPYFHWLVAEVDFLRYKATGVTAVVDAGGPIDPADPWSNGGMLNPQIQPGTSLPYRTETGPVLTQGFQVFLGQTNVLQWGKTGYAPGENGGISGIVHYATTRAENDPRLAAAEEWEPGIPHVQVALYADGDIDLEPCGNFPGAEDIDWNGDGVFDAPDGVVDDVDGDGQAVLTDVDNFPFAWSTVGTMGPEDVDRNSNGLFDTGDAIQLTVTDSWDDNLPTGCVPESATPFSLYGYTPDCYDGLRCFNQVRPAVFDGGYAFDSYVPGGVSSGLTPTTSLPSGTYIVEASAPPGYEHQKEEDKNVDFGQDYVLSELELPPPCVGDLRVVPAELSLFPGVPCEFAGELRPLPDRKQVWLRDGYNGAANFFLFTEVPVAGHVVGFILDDSANEFDPNAPTFGEKYAPPWLPVSFKDWKGREITRVYTDEYGHYNAMIPSTFTVNAPIPSGMAPNMLICTMNDRWMPDPNNPGLFIEDPYYNGQYSQFSYTFQFMPGKTTYLDTPVLPVAAFAGPSQFPLDAKLADGTPMIKRVDGPGGGPYLATGETTLVIQSMGDQAVPNPKYDGPGGVEPATVTRDYGFGATTGQVFINGVAQTIDSWTNTSIQVTTDGSAGQLRVVRGDNGKATKVGVTVHTADSVSGSVLRVGASQAFLKIQEAIDAAGQGDLILVEPGTYFEMVILYKDVMLQGYGPGSTAIDAAKHPTDKLARWRIKAESLLQNGDIMLLPGQGTTFTGIEPEALHREEGAGITVFNVDSPFAFARIDGFTISGGDGAGGIVANGYCENLKITNNVVTGNQGFFGGGIRIGHPDLANGAEFVDAQNDNVTIRYNMVATNSGIAGPGGISIGPGADNYLVSDNYIVGNFSARSGAGIGHVGFSDNGRIENNTIVFNESFYQGTSVSGGGIALVGMPTIDPAQPSMGTGSVTIEGNLVLGNSAGSGDGGGIALVRVNAGDLAGTPNTVNLFDNVIVNNVSALAGGGVSLQDALYVNMIHNTVANNDSTATAGLAFADPNVSTAQPAGVASRGNSPELNSIIAQEGLAAPAFSDPRLENNIIWHNRQFHYDATINGNTGGLVPDLNGGAAAVYADLGVLGVQGARLSPSYCLLTDIANYGGANNVAGDPSFVAEYFNGPTSHLLQPEVNTALKVAAALDEGGNFIQVRYGPLTLVDPDTGNLFGDYRISGGPAVDAGTQAPVDAFTDLSDDFVLGPRPVGAAPDMGAYELPAAGPATLDPPDATAVPAGTGSGGGCFMDTASSHDIGVGMGLFVAALFAMTGLSLALRRAPALAAGILVVVLVVFGAAQPSSAYLRFQCPPDTDGVDTDGDGIVDNDHKCLQIGAGDGFATMADGRPIYTFGFSDLTGVPLDQVMMKGMLGSTWPSPTLRVKEGQKLYLNLTNVGMMIRPDLPDPHTIHWHGFPQAASIFDGVPSASIAINMGSTLTYFYNVMEEGTFMWHCHMEATEHMQMGMLGQIYVEPKQNNLPDGTDLNGFTHHTGYKYAYNDGDGSTYYDLEKAIQLASFDPAFHDANETAQPLPFAAMEDKYPMLNGRGYPDTIDPNPISVDLTAYGAGIKESQPYDAKITAFAGEKILLRLSSLSTVNYFTLGVTGLTMKVVGKGSRLLRGPDGKDLSYETTSVRLGGGEAYDVIIDTTGVEPGTYPLYAHNLYALSNNDEDFGGMMTEIEILPPLNMAITGSGMPADYDPDDPATWPVVDYIQPTYLSVTGGQGANYLWQVQKPDQTTETFASMADSITITAQKWKDMVAASGAGIYTVSVADADTPRLDPVLFMFKAPVFIEPLVQTVTLTSNAQPYAMTLVGAQPDGVKTFTWSFTDLTGNAISQATAEASFGALSPYTSKDSAQSAFDPLNSMTAVPDPFRVKAMVDDLDLAAFGLNAASSGAFSVIPVVNLTFSVQNQAGDPVSGATVTAVYDATLTATTGTNGRAVVQGVVNIGLTFRFIVEHPDYSPVEVSVTDLGRVVNVTLTAITTKGAISGTVSPAGAHTTVKAQAANGSWVVDGNGAQVTVLADPDTGAYAFSFDQSINAAGPFTVMAFRPGYATSAADGLGVVQAAVNTTGNDITLTPITILSGTARLVGADLMFTLTATPAFDGTPGEAAAFDGANPSPGQEVTGSLTFDGTAWKWAATPPKQGQGQSMHARADTTPARTANTGYFTSRTFHYIKGLVSSETFTVTCPNFTTTTVTNSSGTLTVTLPADGLTGPLRCTGIQIVLTEYSTADAGLYSELYGSPLLYDVTLIDLATGEPVPNADIQKILITMAFTPANVPRGNFKNGRSRIRHATNVVELAAGNYQNVPLSRLVFVDYAAGKASFWTNSLSTFGVEGSEPVPTGGGGGGGCFVHTAKPDASGAVKAALAGILAFLACGLAALRNRR